MDRWLLLTLTIVSLFMAFESVRWLRLMQWSSRKEVEKAVGYDGSALPDPERTAAQMKYSTWGLPSLALLFCGLAVGMVIVTVRAFLQ